MQEASLSVRTTYGTCVVQYWLGVFFALAISPAPVDLFEWQTSEKVLRLQLTGVGQCNLLKRIQTLSVNAPSQPLL